MRKLILATNILLSYNVLLTTILAICKGLKGVVLVIMIILIITTLGIRTVTRVHMKRGDNDVQHTK